MVNFDREGRRVDMEDLGWEESVGSRELWYVCLREDILVVWGENRDSLRECMVNAGREGRRMCMSQWDTA